MKAIISKISLLVLLSSTVLIYSCKDESKETETNSATEVSGTTAGDNSNSNSNTTAQLNPEHGQPGHRCDIPVGTPLNATSTINNNTTTTSPVQSSNVSPVRMNAEGATPTKNPPHGQPGHDCAVPVGADLN